DRRADDRRLHQPRGPAGQGREPLCRDRRQRPGTAGGTRRERCRPADPGRAGELQRQRGRGAGVDDRDPACVRDQRQGDLDHRPDARLPEPEPVIAMTRLLPALASAALLLLAGCASVMGDVRPFEPYAPVGMPPGMDPAGATAHAAPGAYPPPAAQAGGSIYAGTVHAAPRPMSLFEDNKARHVGDLLTIVLVERTSSSSRA